MSKRKRKPRGRRARSPAFSQELLALAARKMLTRNYPVNDIAEITGLSLADVEGLAAAGTESGAAGDCMGSITNRHA